MKSKLYSIVIVLLFALGLTTIILATYKEKLGLELSSEATISLQIVGIILWVSTIFFIYLYVNSLAKENKELMVEDKDERNRMIRGKAAENTLLIMTFIIFILNAIFICLKESLVSIILSLIIFLYVIINVIFVSYYNKKY